MIYFKITTGNFFERFQIISAVYNKTHYSGNLVRDLIDYYPKLVLLLHHSHFKYLYGLFFYVGGIMVFYYMYKYTRKIIKKRYAAEMTEVSKGGVRENKLTFWRERNNFYVLIILLVFWIIYLQVGSMSISKYVIIEKHERFLTLITIPFLLLIAHFLTSYKSRMRKYFNVVCVTILFLSSLYCTNISSHFHSLEIQDSREIKKYLEGKSYEKIYADRETNFKLDFLFQYKNRRSRIDLNRLYGINSIKGNSYIITHGKGFRDLKPSLMRKLSDEGALWKQGWKLEKIIGNNTLEGFKDNKPRIFYLP
jgi:hypothetical protein